MRSETIPSQDLIECKICGGLNEADDKRRLWCRPCTRRKQVEYTRKYRQRVKASNVLRICKTCSTEFLPANGRTWKCSSCLAAYQLEYAKRHKECAAYHQKQYRLRQGDKYRSRMIGRRRDAIAKMSPDELTAFRRKEADKTRRLNALLKNEVFTAYGGWRCNCCGETERSFLSIDHMQNNGSKMRRAGIHGHSTDFYRWLRKNGFPAEFQVLCMNCQFGKRMNNGACPHQVRRNDYPEREYGQAAGSAVPLN